MAQHDWTPTPAARDTLTTADRPDHTTGKAGQTSRYPLPNTRNTWPKPTNPQQNQSVHGSRLKLATPICGGLESPSRDFGSKNLTHPSPRFMSPSPRSASRQSMKPSTQR